MKKILSLLFSFVLLGLVGCASTASQKPTVITESQQIKKTIIEKVPNINPDWIAKTSFIKDGKRFVVGFAEGFTNLQASRTAAGTFAKTRFAQQIKDTFTAETASAIESGLYSDDTGGYVREVFYSSIDKLQVDGIMLEENYSEQIQEQDGSSNKIYWRSYCLASIPEAKYKEVVARAFDETENQIKKEKQAKQNESAKQLVEKLKEKFDND